MNALEELLSDAMTDASDDVRSVEADWERVTNTVAARQRRKANTYRVGVILLIAVLGFGVFTSRFGIAVDTVANPADSNSPAAQVPEVGIWPTAEDVAAAAGERPHIQFWIAWLIAAGLPLLAALNAWVRAPEHLRVPIASQRLARIVLASSAALAATIAVGLAVCAVLFFTYDPLAAQSGTSYLLSVLGIVDLSLISSVVILGFSLSASRDPGDGVGARVFVGWLGALVALFLVGFARSIFLLEFDWKTTDGVEGPTRGLWRLFVPSDAVYSGPSGGVISVAGAVSGATVGLVGVVVALWFARTATMSALAGDRLRSLAADVGSTAADARSRALRMNTWLLVALAAALPAYVYVQKDVVAQSVAHIAALPPEVVDLSDGFGPWVERDVDRGVFEQLDLVEITFFIPRSDTPLADITDQQLLPERFGFDHRGESVVVRHLSSSFDRQFWSVERDEQSRTIIVSVRREVAAPGMNTALFIASLLILAATSTWIPKMVSKQDLEASAIPGRRMGAWFVITASAVIGIHLVGSLIGLAVTVGNRASRGGETLYEFYTLGGRSSPAVLDDLSPWFLLLNVFTFVPLFGLVILGVRRLTNSANVTRAMLVMTVLSPIVTFVMWGELILDWIEWFLD